MMLHKRRVVNVIKRYKKFRQKQAAQSTSYPADEKQVVIYGT